MVKHEEVRTFVGIDAHSGNCSLKGISRKGRKAYEGVVATDAESLRSVVEDLKAPVWAMVEASSIAPFVKWSLEAVVDRVIVCETRENRWIASSEDKSDAHDADRLARLLRMGEYREVYVGSRAGQELRELVGLYDKAVGDVVRAKNRLKAKFREHGVEVGGDGIYQQANRPAWVAKLSRASVRFMAEVLYRRLEDAEAVRDDVAARLRGMLYQRREYRALRQIPGVGDVVATILVAVIQDPSRFADKRKLWNYSGLSVRRQSSGKDTRGKQGGSSSGNRLMRYASMVAAKSAGRGDSRFGRRHRELIERGMDARVAHKTIARGILATALAVWKNGTRYCEDR